MIDTLRILVDWKCNLKCSYCCNEQEHSRSQFKSKSLAEIDFTLYSTICISGGEPLLFLDRVGEIVKQATTQFVVLYSNGTLMTEMIAKTLEQFGVKAINIGLHYPASFRNIIHNVLKSTENTKISVRFQVWDKYKTMNLEAEFPEAHFKYWVMDECDRGNEERVILNA